MRSSFSFNCSMTTVAFANALGRLTRPFASVDLVSRPNVCPPFIDAIYPNIHVGGKAVKWEFPTGQAVGSEHRGEGTAGSLVISNSTFTQNLALGGNGGIGAFGQGLKGNAGTDRRAGTAP